MHILSQHVEIYSSSKNRQFSKTKLWFLENLTFQLKLTSIAETALKRGRHLNIPLLKDLFFFCTKLEQIQCHIIYIGDAFFYGNCK